MKKQELIVYLNSFSEIIYNNGKRIDRINLGNILAQYVENELGSQAYQEFNIFLNEVLTLERCEELLNLYDKGYFLNYIKLYIFIKKDYSESIILSEFRSLVELIEIQLNDIINLKQAQLNRYIEGLIDEIIGQDKGLAQLIDHEKAIIFIQNKVGNIINLRSKTAKQLNRLDLDRADRKILLKQIEKTLFQYCRQI